LGPWLEIYHPTQVYPAIQNFVKHLRSDPSHKKIGAIGFCWGGLPVVQLVQKGADPYVDASVACHPAPLGVPEDVEKVEKPLSIHVGDLDDFLPGSEVEKVKEVFKNKPECSIEVYEGQVHGFSNRGDLTVEKDRKAKELVAEKVNLFYFNC
jgi:dienelactone hydrolase